MAAENDADSPRVGDTLAEFNSAVNEFTENKNLCLYRGRSEKQCELKPSLAQLADGKRHALVCSIEDSQGGRHEKEIEFQI